MTQVTTDTSKLSLLLVCALLSGAGCDARTGVAVPARPDPRDDLFAAAPRVIELAVELPIGEAEFMLGGPYAYGRATLREGGTTYEDVGIRYKGNPAKEAASGRPDFRLHFNEFESRPLFHGCDVLLLLACRDDPSYLSAPLGLELYREAGVPAARYAFARVRLNERALGLYVVVEGVDRRFLARFFERTDGNLYDEGENPDIVWKLERFGGGRGQPDADALAAAALRVDPVERWYELGQRLDVPRFLTYAALEVLLWQRDSYSVEATKFRIYHDPVTDRMVFFPKNVEVLLERTDGPLMPEWKGIVARGLMTTAEGRQRYRETLARLLSSVFAPEKVQRRGRELAALIGPALAGGDAGAGAAHAAAAARFLDAVAERASFASVQLNALAAR